MTRRDIPNDVSGFPYDGDLFTESGVPTPEEQQSGDLQDVDTDRSEIVNFLKAVYPTTPDGVVTFTTFTVTGRSINTPQRLGEWTAEQNNGIPAVHDHEWLADRIIRAVQGAAPTGKESAEHWPYVPITGAFLRMPTTMAEWPAGNQRGGQSNVCELVGFVLDGDYNVPGHHKGNGAEGGLPRPDSAEEVLSIWSEAIGGAPTIVWNSGGGINGAWLLDEPIRITEGEDGALQVKAWRAASGRFHDRVVRTAKERGFKHDSVPNNDRLMRIPGTMNAKKDCAPKMARIVSAHGPRYSLEALLALAPEPVLTDDGSLVDPITGEIVRGPRPVLQNGWEGTAQKAYDDGERPYEHFDRETWETGAFRDILRADGWTEEGFHNGILHFWRPGKGEGQQISATLGANEGVGALSHGAKFFVFSDNAPGLLGTTYKGQFLSPSLYNAVTRHNGDLKANNADLRRQGYGAPSVPSPATTPETSWEPPSAPAPAPAATFEVPEFTGRMYERVPDGEGGYTEKMTAEYREYMMMKHGGGTAVAEAPEGQAEEPKKDDRFKSLDWDEAFATDFTQIDWLPGKICERGQQIAIVGSGKVGKSMFMFDWLYRAITGKTFLGDQRRPPVKVLYFDKENSLRDIVTRMKALGATPDELRDNFVYKLHPAFTGGLDQGGVAVMELAQIVDQEQPDVIVFDTVSRFIGGKENDSDTWIQFYRRVHANLKKLGIAGIRLDHMGKDETKGSRGSSAKSQDVDHVWEMTKVDETRTMGTNGGETITTVLCMTRTHTRTGIGPDELNVARIGVKFGDMWADGQTKHTVLDREAVKAAKNSVQPYVDELIDAGVPKGLGRDKLKAWAASQGITLPGNNDAVAKIVKAVGHYHAEQDAVKS